MGWLRALAKIIAVLAVAVASIALSLWITPMQRVTAAGQTVQVGVTAPSWSVSGPGELDLFGQSIPTTLRFDGPVRPRLALRQITLSDQLGQFVSGSASDAAHQLQNALVSGWERFFVWQLVLAGVIAIVLFGAIAGWLRRGWKPTLVLLLVGALVTGALDAGAIMVTAYTAPAKLRQVRSLQDLVGGAPPPTLPAAQPRSPGTIRNVVVIGDSTAAGAGLPSVAHPTPDDTACRRSTDAYAVALATANGWHVTNLACGGATIRAGLLGPQTVGGRTQPPQLDASEVGTADVIIVSIGANDVHWSDLLLACAVSQSCSNKAEQAYFQQQLAGFSRDYLQLLSQLQLLRNHPVVLVNSYYDPFPDTVDCLTRHGITADKRASLEDDLAVLNEILHSGAQAAGFLTAKPDFSGHGVCSNQPYVQGVHAPAPFHPTASGQLAIALADQRALHTS